MGLTRRGAPAKWVYGDSYADTVSAFAAMTKRGIILIHLFELAILFLQ